MLVENTGTQVSGVVGAIQNAARATATSFEYLLATAQVESGFNPNASAISSSARGLFQFIEQTWLATVKNFGPSLGYGRYADAIVRTSSGRYEVPDHAMRHQILTLRADPTANAVMAGAFTRANAARLTGRLGRPPKEGELYIAHFLGASGAARLINLASDQPGTNAANVFPSAAKANRAIFFDKQGHARSAAEVYRALSGRYDLARAGPTIPTTSLVDVPITPPSPVAPALPPVTVASSPASNRPVIQSLFSDDPQRGAVSQVVRDLWATRPHVAAALTATTAPVSESSTAPPSASLDLFADRPTDARGLFGNAN